LRLSGTAPEQAQNARHDSHLTEDQVHQAKGQAWVAQTRQDEENGQEDVGWSLYHSICLRLG